jgi:hypothetical protein
MEAFKKLFNKRADYKPLNPELAQRRFWLKNIFLWQFTV